ncbi:MAG: DUF4058 family protein [Caldilineaceae bacterium]|nr:DUF4058 family protein [Caldilineaceae bacterium]
MVVIVPLRRPDPDITLDLQSALTTVYEDGAYDVQLDYAKPVPPPPLSARQNAWVDQLLQRAN